ncbi:MAG: hypothetical protein D6701_07430 [Gemmatimonadetes bacterium]|nr:MAG: hypothetical protein D6701_07430 [Gemmatimonadota bacterium]
MSRRWLDVYLGLTPVFLAADLLLNAPLRLAALPSLGMRVAYYLVLTALWLLVRSRPLAEAVLAVVEGVVNLTLLMLSILLPIWATVDQVLADQPIVFGLTRWKLANLAVVGPALIVVIRQNEAALLHALFGGRRLG